MGVFIYALKPSRRSSLTAALFFVAAAFYLTMFDAHTSYRFSRVWLLYPLLGPLSVHLFAVFPETRPHWSRPSLLAALYAVGLLVVAWRQAAFDDPAAYHRATLGSALMLVGAFAADLGLLGFAMTHGATRAVRNRAKSMFVGLALTCTAAVAWQFAAQLSALLTADVVMVLSALFPALIAYAILARNIFDLDDVLRAGLIYGLATAFVVAVYFGAVAGVGQWVGALAGHSTAVAVAATVIAAALFHPVRRFAQRLVDRVLFRDRPDELLRALVAGELEPLGPILRRWTGAERALILQRAPRGDRLEGDGVVVPLGGALERTLVGRPRPQWLRDLDGAAARECEGLPGVELLVPLVVRGRLSGLLALSKTGVMGYSRLRALEDLAPQLGLAVENAALVAEGAERERLAALGQLAAVIVHEVKNPLGIIKVSAGTLRTRARDEAQRELAACVEDEVDRLDATVRRLLELARPVEPRTTATRRAPVDVTQVVKQTLTRLQPDFDGAAIRVSADLDGAPSVRADIDDLRAALLNLLVNARQAMPEGGELTVRVRAGSSGVEIEIADTGVGMDEATRRQLFRPFFTTRRGGTGLGLALVKRVVEDHRGVIRVESTPGAGSRFTLTLPS
jgi:signal transduction histidine kinase